MTFSVLGERVVLMLYNCPLGMCISWLLLSYLFVILSYKFK